MSQYYKVPRDAKWNFNPQQKNNFKLSRSKIDLFLNCPKCFYLDARLGIKQPPSYPFNLNSAVDFLLKKEFDVHRAENTKHPLMRAYSIDAVPFQHEKMDAWRDSLRNGITYEHPETGLLISGGVDDIWQNPQGELIVVDYKATAKNGEVNLDADWQISYKRQMEIYQWLFRKNGFQVSDTGYFVYCNGRTDAQAFDGKLEFDVTILPYSGRTDWVEPAIFKAHQCLMSEQIPEAALNCNYCQYRQAARCAD